MPFCAVPNSTQFRNYTPDDGLQSYEFNTGVFFKTRDGELLFGGITGLNAFDPDSVRDNPNVPQIALTGFKKFDQPFDVGGDISAVKSIALKYAESVFSFDFTALEFTNPKRNRYAYMMGGFDKGWIYCGERHGIHISTRATMSSA